MKRYRFSLTLRIFLTTSALLIAACAITYATIAYLTPITYTSILEEERARQSDALVAALEQATPDTSDTLLADFVRQTGADVILVDAWGEVLYTTLPQSGPVSEAAQDTAYSETLAAATTETDTQVTVVQEAGSATASNDPAMDSSAAVMEGTATEVLVQDTTASMYSFAFADGTWASITIQGGLRAVNRAVEALGQVLPFLVGVILLISLAGSFFYARFITRPIVGISGLARRLASLDFTARWRTPRNDEIGDLGDSLNLLSDNLSTALHQLEDANQRLQDDMEREREMERQRMAFFAAASHELKTPITILKGQLSGMLARVGIYQDREKYLARALTVTGRMENLVREILTINRIGAGGFALREDTVNLSALVRDQLALDMELVEQKSLVLTQDIAPEVLIRGDAALLAKALDNVLMNAILYSPPGASIQMVVRPGLLRVENDGVSIPQEALAQLFTPFYRVEQSRNRKSGGSGLGLYLVKSIFDLHGIACGMENTAQGVRFWTELEGPLT